MLEPSDFATREEALAHANSLLDEWNEKFEQLESDMILRQETPTEEEVRKTGWKLEHEVIELRGAKT